MSIKGFIVNGQTQKYDYGSLDNKPTIPSGGGGEISNDLKAALVQLAQKIAYIDTNGGTYYQDLYEALYGSSPTPVTTYTVTNNLTAVTNSNNSVSVSSGSSYAATLTPAIGYTISTVVITMGGTDITSTTYSNGTISIPSVSGNISITALATQQQDSSPVITDYDSRLSNTAAVTAQTGMCVTDFYELNDSGVTIYTYYTEAEEPYSVANLLVYNSSKQAQEHWNAKASNSPNPKIIDFSSYGTFSYVRFTLYTSGLNDCYCYETNTGTVLFAGVDSPYYNMSNISEAGS